MSDLSPFDRLAPKSTGMLTSEGEPHAKLKRNLVKALDRQDELLDSDTSTIGGRMVVAGVAATVVRAALTTDKTALKARSDNTLERVLLRLVFYRKLLGRETSPDELKRLREAPRAEIEAALGPRIADYDRMEW